MKIFLVLALVVAASAGSTTAQTLEESRAAYDRGDYDTALRGFRPLAEQGHAQAQAGLGFMYHQGKGVAADGAEAARWFRRAAEQGIAQAQYNLEVMYGLGEGVAEDAAEAAKWYRRAAEQGFADAQFKLGNMYARGRGVPQNYLWAHVWVCTDMIIDGNIWRTRSKYDRVMAAATSSLVAFRAEPWSAIPAKVAACLEGAPTAKPSPSSASVPQFGRSRRGTSAWGGIPRSAAATRR